MPYIMSTVYGPPAQRLFHFPITMIEDSALPDYYEIYKKRPIINTARVTDLPECITKRLTYGDDDSMEDFGWGESWIQQCWTLPDMSIKSNSPILNSTAPDTIVTKNFGGGVYPWAYDSDGTPVSKHKIVRVGTYSGDLATFGRGIRRGWGRSTTWSNSKIPGAFSIDIKAAASYMKNNGVTKNAGVVVADFIGVNNQKHENQEPDGSIGFLRDVVTVYSGNATYDADSWCGTDIGGVLGIGIRLGNWRPTVADPNQLYGNLLALHVSLGTFDINAVASSSASSILWYYTPVGTDYEAASGAYLPKRACLRISVCAI